jgi:hypothetical protein
VLLSASTPEAAVNLARSSGEIKAMGRDHGTDGYVPEIGFGGKVFTDMPFLQEGVDGIYCGHDAKEAVEIVEGFLEQGSQSDDGA